MKKIILLWTIAFAPVFVFAQTLTVQLSETDKSPVVGAMVRLIDRADTTQQQRRTTDTAGIVTFAVNLQHQYQIQAQSIGLKPLSKGVRIQQPNARFTYTMEADAKALGDVNIVAKRPLMRQEEDKTIVDPTPIANTSTNAYEIVERTPGLFVDQDGNIYLNSATPATVFINGREQRMSAADIAGILKSLPPGSIERIEILRTPSAKYDASGSGGVVNVVLKKGVKIGRTGSASVGYNQGRFHNEFASINLNNSDGDRTSTFNLSYSGRNNYDQIITTRQLGTARSLSQRAYTTSPSQSYYSGYSLGYEPTKKWEFSADGRLNYSFNRGYTNNVSRIEGAASELMNSNTNELRNRTQMLNLNQGFKAKYKIDSLGSEWTFDASYNYNHSNGLQFFDIFTPETATVSTLGGAGDIRSRRHFVTAQMDWRQKLPHKLVVEAGAKTAVQFFNNQTAYDALLNGNHSVDRFRTNTYRYNDQIHAAYAQASKTFWGDFVVKTGVRMENTHMNGQQRVPSDTAFRIRRTDFFPYVYLSKPLAKIANFPLKGFLIYRRSITRPSYDLLNPFPRFLDPFLYEAGNPVLQPQFTRNVEFNISMMDFPILAVGRNYIDDIFTNVIYQDPRVPEVAYRTYDNLGKNTETYFRAVAGMPPGGKFFFVIGAQYNHNRYNGFYENSPLTFTRGSWTFFTFQQLRIDKRSSLTINGFMRQRGQLQFYELSNFGSLNLSVNRMFLDRKLTVTLSVNDIFYTNRNEFTLNQGSIAVIGNRQSDTRRVGLNVRYNFGMRKKNDNGMNPFNLDNLEKSTTN